MLRLVLWARSRAKRLHAQTIIEASAGVSLDKRAEIMQGIYKLNEGTELTITPLNGFSLRMLLQQAKKTHPDPDPALYEQELPEGFALVEGQKLEAEHNPAYRLAQLEARTKQTYAYTGLVLQAAITTPDRDALCTKYAHTIARLRSMSDEVAEGAGMVDDFTTLLTGVLMVEGEVGAIMRLAQGAIDLSQTDVIDGLTFFRPVAIRRSPVAGVRARPEPQDISEPEPEPSHRPTP